ncbi:MAG: ThiF family adenylyltransferase [Nanoarchaeota archaeon]|nr:ThiF family adenylyltransferase [Nanoarchaeota archaeon]
MQQKTITLIGVGALGSNIALLLGAQGISLNLIDRDIVEPANLDYGIYTKKDLGKSKALVMKEKLQKSYPSLTITAHDENLDSSTLHLLQGNIIIDGTDNMHTRFLINDYTKKYRKTWIYGSVLDNEGYCAALQPAAACYNCIYNNKTTNETCATRGVNQDVLHSIALLQTQLTLNILNHQKILPQLYYINSTTRTIKTYTLKKNSTCTTCNGHYTHLNKPFPITSFCGTNTYQIRGNYQGKKPNHQAIIHLTPNRVLIKAKNEKEALSIHAKYFGH